MQMPRWVTTMWQQVDAWAQQQQQQRPALPSMNPTGWPPWHWKLKLPWHEDKKRKEELQEEYRRRKAQIADLCEAVKVENLVELQDVLGAMILAECAYKRPDAEVLQAMNSFKADFGGQLISLCRIQTCLDHVPHRYILAEGGDTLFAAFAGTKHYRDFITDANFLQGALFHDDENEAGVEEEVERAVGSSDELSTLSNVKPKLPHLKPAAHRGFLSRAKGIPAVELYRLAQKRDRKLVLCGHSLGGAVAVLATLAILRVFATPSVTKSGGRLQIKCITFSQPPVGNGALRDHVHQKGWQHHFQTYCIPEDLIPRILSPAYFQHFRTQASNLISQVAPVEPTVTSEASKEQESGDDRKRASDQGSNDVESDRLILGVPLPKYIWRLPKLVPLRGSPQPFRWFKARSTLDGTPGIQDTKPETQEEVTPLEIKENAESVTLTPSLPISDVKVVSLKENGDPHLVQGDVKGRKSGSLESDQEVNQAADGNKEGQGSNGSDWLKRVPSVSVPSLPSYVPFGQLYLLERSSVVPLSASEYTQLTSVQSVIQELKQRFRSHTMRSYRARFLRIYDSCMSDNSTSALKVEHLPHLPHLQNWLGILGARIVEAGVISEPVVLRTATSLVPLGWTGLPGDRGERPLVVDVHGFGLHLCTLVRAKVNGCWCSTTLESLPPRAFPQQELQHVQPKLQKMRICIGPPLNNKSERKTVDDGSDEVITEGGQVANSFETLSGKAGLPKVDSKDLGICEVEGLGEVTIECSTDFMTASQDVVARLRRVRLLGLEGAGKTSLYFALLGRGGRTVSSSDGGVLPDMDLREGVADGINYVDAAGVNLQDLANETEQLRQEVRLSTEQRGKKLDLVILVHNLAHKIPRLHGGDSMPPRPALGLLLDEISAAGIPVILAITNKFAVSADRRHLAALTIMNTYQVPPDLTVVVNSCPYNVHGLSSESLDSLVPPLESSSKGPVANGIVQGAAQRLFFGPMKLVPRPFGKREVVLPTEGIKKLNSLVQTVLSNNEEAAYEDYAKEQLELRMAEELVQGARVSARGVGKSGAAAAAAVGAAFGAGFGVLVAVVVGASFALRKP